MPPSHSSLSQEFLPPAKFFPVGTVTWAQFAPAEPAYIAQNKKKVKGSRAAGLAYERKAKVMLETCFFSLISPLSPPPEASLLLGPWISYKTAKSSRICYCQPDVLLVNSEEKKLTIYEIKLQHCTFAWWQVRKLYEPILRKIYPNFTISAMEIVKWLDPHIPFPETFYYASSPFDLFDNRFGIHIYDGRKGYLKNGA